MAVSFSEAPFALRWKGMVWVEQMRLSQEEMLFSLLYKRRNSGHSEVGSGPGPVLTLNWALGGAL